jgi:acyl-CoA reductase-like NAD-dependent aldehyde dehydrogenase
MTIAQKQVFGPVFGVMVVDSDEETIRLAVRLHPIMSHRLH